MEPGSGVVEIFTCKQGEFYQQGCHYLNIQEQSETSYRLYSWIKYMQGTCGGILKHVHFHLFGVLRRFQHCTGHITTGSWKGRGNQYIQLVKVLYCKLPTNSKQLPAFPLEAIPGTEPRPQRWEARVLPLCHHGPYKACANPVSKTCKTLAVMGSTYNTKVSHKTPLTSCHTCTNVQVTEKNRRICKGHLSYPCDFITEFQGRIDPTMKIDMHIFSACT